MKKLLLGSAGLAVLIAGPAIAADMQVKAPAPVAYYDWSGAYIGFKVPEKQTAPAAARSVFLFIRRMICITAQTATNPHAALYKRATT